MDGLYTCDKDILILTTLRAAFSHSIINIYDNVIVYHERMYHIFVIGNPSRYHR